MPLDTILALVNTLLALLRGLGLPIPNLPL